MIFLRKIISVENINMSDLHKNRSLSKKEFLKVYNTITFIYNINRILIQIKQNYNQEVVEHTENKISTWFKHYRQI